MEKKLDQSEIDSLFASMRADVAIDADVPVAAAEPAIKKDAFNFSRAGQISNEQMKAISTVNDLFARNLTNNLGAWLRSQFQVTLVSGEQMM